MIKSKQSFLLLIILNILNKKQMEFSIHRIITLFLFLLYIYINI